MLPRSPRTVLLTVLGTILFATFALFFRHSFSVALIPPHPRSRKLHLLFPINSKKAHESSHFCKTLLSAVVHGYEPTVINWNIDGEVGLMQRMKVTGVFEYLTNLTDAESNDIVLMADALDVWLQLSPATVIERYEEIKIDGGVVVGADKACWPNDWSSPACQDVPESTLPRGVYGSNIMGPEESHGVHTRPRWANSGTVIGAVAAMRDLYKDLALVIASGRVPGSQGSDQGIFNEFLHARRLSLDYKSRLFWNTASASPVTSAHFINAPHPLDPFIPHLLYPPLLYEEHTGEIPAVIHFNDHTTKRLMDEWWGRLWWNKLTGTDGDERFRGIVVKRVDDAEVRFVGGKSRTWRDVCNGMLSGI